MDLFYRLSMFAFFTQRMLSVWCHKTFHAFSLPTWIQTFISHVWRNCAARYRWRPAVAGQELHQVESDLVMKTLAQGLTCLLSTAVSVLSSPPSTLFDISRQYETTRTCTQENWKQKQKQQQPHQQGQNNGNTNKDATDVIQKIIIK